MNRDDVLAFCLGLPGAQETYPFGDGVAVCKVGGKMFALVNLYDDPVSTSSATRPALSSCARRTPASARDPTRTSGTGTRSTSTDP